jgi:hypothetical protein
MPDVATWLAAAFSGSGNFHPDLAIARIVGGVAESTIVADDALITNVSFSVDATQPDAAFLSIAFRTVHPTSGIFAGTVGSLSDTGFEPSSLQIAISGVGGAGPNVIQGMGFQNSVVVGGTNPDGYHYFSTAGHQTRNTFTIGTPASETMSRADLGTWFDSNLFKSLTLTITDGATATLQIAINQLRASSSLDFFGREDGRVYLTVDPVESSTDTFTVTFTN